MLNPIDLLTLRVLVIMLSRSASGGADRQGAAYRNCRSRALVVRYGDRFLQLLPSVIGQLRRSELEGQLVDLAGEGERHLVVLVVHPRAGVDADVEGLVRRQQERDRVFGSSCVATSLPSTFSTPVPPLAMPGPS